MMKLILLACCTLVLARFAGPAAAAEWKAADGPLMTRWAKDVGPDNALPEYPRPQMVRKDWQNLNGLWDYAIRPKAEPKPEKWDGQILVPFCAESALSGVMKDVGAENRLWYRRTFTVPESWKDRRVLLHFGAVDWDTTVWVNGKQVGTHRGGYDPFTFDLADAVKQGGGNEIVVSVWDPTDTGEQPRGKQLRKPRGIWYTPVTGIWQTVWIEPVAKSASVESLKIVPDIDRGVVRVTVDVRADKPNETVVAVSAFDADVKKVGTQTGKPGEPIEVAIKDAKLWTPESPYLYSLGISVGGAQDVVDSYFAMRKSSLGKDDKGVLRLMLNDKPVFHVGPLDQGWWPDGLYTAPTDEALKYDIEVTKKLGFNMARKHTKVEPDRWYYWCDKLGLLVWQDMVTGFREGVQHQRWDPVGTYDGKENTRSPEDREIYDRELKAMIDALHNHPSIVMWVPFNEGWGQFDTVRVTNWIKQYDPTRLVNCASGGNDFPVGDVKDLHSYPGPDAPKPDGKRASVLGEFGGLGLTVNGHTWPSDRKWGYRDYANSEELADAYENLFLRLRPLIDDGGLAAAVYTQTTDVEGEVNGLLTYDRAVIKMPEERVRAAHAALQKPPAEVRTIVPDARAQAVEWRYTTEKPAEGWERPDFDDSQWKTAPAPFGTPDAPAGLNAKTTGDATQIWLRRSFDLPADQMPKRAHLTIHHGGDTEVFLNGVSATQLRRYTTEYGQTSITPAAQRALKAGKNVIAAHVKRPANAPGYIDVGLVDIVPKR